MGRPPVSARPPIDPAEERTLRRLASARHAPASLIQRARIITGSWDGASVPELAQQLGCHPKTVYKWLQRFNQTHGIDGLADLPRPGLPRRSSEHERGRIIQLAGTEPPGRLQQGGEGLLAPPSPRRRRGGPWTRSPGLPRPRASRWAAARSVGSCWPKAPAGGSRARGRPAPTRSSSQRAQVIACYTTPPPQTTVICADELGPVIPRSFPPAPGWTLDGHRVKAPLDYGRGPEKTWVYGALRVGDGQEVTMTAPSRNSVGYQQLLAAVETANPDGAIVVITDNLSSHNSASTRTWLADHPRIQQVFIPKRACWLNLQEGWWRLFRRQALAGQSFATPEEITLATTVATCQLNARARPWVWGRPPPFPRHRRHAFTYRI
jgi:transposase